MTGSREDDGPRDDDPGDAAGRESASPGGARAAPRREVLRLAVPAFFTLVAEPLFLLADSAIVGHLGTIPLAGLGVAGAVLAAASSVFVFLAYGTTALVSRRIGAGDHAGALSAGIDGIWLALALGLLTAVLTALGARDLVSLFGASPAATDAAAAYLRVSAAGIPAMLLVLAVTGVLRGMQDTRTPLLASTLGFSVNIALNVALVYGAGLGIVGAALGTVLAQSGMAAGLLIVVSRHVARTGASLRPRPLPILRAAAHGVPLLVRTLALRASILLTTWVAARLGDVPVAAYQVAATIWTFLAFALDAIAIAGQTLTGTALGAGDVAGVRAAMRLMVRWSLAVGAALGALILLSAPVLPALFTSDPAVRAALVVSLIVIGLGQPLAAYAFVLDGILIGAGDGRWLAGAGVVVLVAYAPAILLVNLAGADLLRHGEPIAVAVLWLAYLVFIGLRALALHLRARSQAWLVTGAPG